MNFAILGGDMRQAALARLLREDGHAVSTAGLGETTLSAAQAASGAECVILPMPVCRTPGVLNAPAAGREISLAEALDALTPDQTVLAAMADASSENMAAARDVTLTDYGAREELTAANAVITAENALCLLMQELPVTLAGLRALVVGCGRIGRALALRLHALGASVTVSARKPADLAWICANGLDAADTRRLSGMLGDYGAVVNTVPAPVLDEALLGELGQDCLVLDLASRPGGTDFDAARRLGVRTVWALGLPGKMSPVSAGAAVRDTVYNILRERGLLNG